MKLNVNRATVYHAVRECLTEIVMDFKSDRLDKSYVIEFQMSKDLSRGFKGDIRHGQYKLPIKRPDIVYNLILEDGLNGLETVTESFTNDLIKRINETI